MARKRRTTFLRALGKLLNINQITEIADDSPNRNYRSIGDAEYTKKFRDISVPNVQRNSASFDPQSIPAMIDPITRDLLDRRMDNEKLLTLAPEVTQAASIIIPTILSPNNFSKSSFSVIVEGGNESDEVKTKIAELVSHHFRDEMDLHIKLSEWLEDAKFRVGCKAVLILPTTFISQMKEDLTSFEGLSNNVHNLVNSVTSSMESLNLDVSKPSEFKVSEDDIVDNVMQLGIFNDRIDLTPRKERTSIERKIRSTIKSKIRDVFKDFDGKLKYSHDARTFLANQIESQVAVESLNKEFNSKLGSSFSVSFRDKKETTSKSRPNLVGFKYAPYIDLSKYIVNNKIGDFPALIELPGESVIPIIIEGSPSVHIGYFVTLNENGVPISINNDSYSDLVASTYGSQRINRLFNSFYGNSQMSMHQKLAMDAKFEILNSIYDGYLQNLLKSKLTDVGLKNHRIDLNSSVTRIMFSRLLKGTETRIVFIPKKLMNYLAFQYNADGTGRSKLEDIKFPLSLKMTLIITRLISLIESSINRRTLNISLDDTSGNPLELYRMIRKDFMANKQYGLSYDPDTIIKTTQDKSFTIVPDKIPGVESFSIQDGVNNVEYPKPDDAILEEINNMYMLSLDVPPSAMNRLGEEEFSRSVAANNIFFANKICRDQQVTMDFMSDLMQTYIEYSKALTDGIAEILKSDSIEGSSEQIDDPKLADSKLASVEKIVGDSDELKDETDETISEEDRLSAVLENIRFSLPAPNMVHDKAGFEELRDYIEIVTTIVDSLYPDEMVLDSELANTIKVLRANLKRAILQTRIKDNSLLSDLNFDALSDVGVVDNITTTQKMLNLKIALEKTVAVLSGTPTTTDDATSSWG